MWNVARIVLMAAVGFMPAVAAAQNVGANNGIWWSPAPGQPAAFTFLNPMTTLYGRVGMLHAWQPSAPLLGPDVVPNVTTRYGDQFGAMIALGARLMPVLRHEILVAGTLNTNALFSAPPIGIFGRMRVGSVQVMSNLIIDTAPFFGNRLAGFNPYIFGGIGVAFNANGDIINTSGAVLEGTGGTHVNFAWNAGAGLQYQLLDGAILDLGYRYVDAGRYRLQALPFFPGPNQANLVSHQAMISVILPFAGMVRAFGN